MVSMRRTLVNILTSIASIALTFLVVELGARVYTRDFSFRNYLGEAQTLFRSAYPAQYDPELGWVPKVGAYETENIWGTTVTILENGIRSNGGAARLEGTGSRPILAVGDSFTFGDQVSDHETWPAALERLLGKQVINGGVFAYGMDQCLLRAKRLAQAYKPDVLVFGVFPDDINRCEMSQRMGVQKPYFDVVENALVLRNTPVPRPRPAVIGLLRNTLGHSVVFHHLMMRLAPGRWIRGPDWRAIRVHSNGMTVARLLLQDLTGIAEEYGIEEVYVLIQYAQKTPPEMFRLVDYVTDGVQTSSISVVDLRYALADMKDRDRGAYQRMFRAHMTDEGNELVARVLRDAMEPAR